MIEYTSKGIITIYPVISKTIPYRFTIPRRLKNIEEVYNSNENLISVPDIITTFFELRDATWISTEHRE